LPDFAAPDFALLDFALLDFALGVGFFLGSVCTKRRAK
jgi:hypothetical protein